MWPPAAPSVKGGDSYQQNTNAVPSTILRALRAASLLILRARLIVMPTLQVRKPRHRGDQSLALGHTAQVMISNVPEGVFVVSK